MSSRADRLLLAGAWGLTVFTTVMTAVAVWAGWLLIAEGVQPKAEPFPLVSAVPTFGFAIAGLIVLLRRPRNRIGWLFVVAAAMLQPETAVIAVMTYVYEVLGTPMRWLEIVAVASDSLWLPAFAAGGTLLFLLFPDGRPPSPRWNWLVWTTLLSVAVWIPATLFIQEGLYAFEEIPNPLGIEWLTPFLVPIQIASTSTVVLGIPAAAISLVQRIRRARGTERQQLKFLLVPVLAFAAAVIVGIAFDGTVLASVILDLVTITLPLAVLAAVTRRGLWGIDRLLARTLTYTLVVAVVVGLYAFAVLGLGTLARTVSGGRGELVVALSTLLVAAAFQPLRRRTQDVMDRRFNRTRYDAERTVAAFAGRLRDQVDVDRLSVDVRRTVSQVLAPRSVAVWVKEGVL